MMIRFKAIALIFAYGFAATRLLADVFGIEDHCVAWKAEKRMFFISKSEPVGKNCSIDLEFQAMSGDENLEQTYKLIMKVPIDKFDSGEPDRDEEVQKILRSHVRSDILIETDLMDRKSWVLFWSGEGDGLPVKVWIGEEIYQLNLVPKVDSEYIKGSIKTQFSQFDISRPKVVMGAVASVSDDFELHFQMRKSQIKNSDWLPSNNQKI